jgi:hypothetical protein
MIETLITNKTRIKLLLRFFLNGESRSYLRGLEEEFGESTNAIRIELNRFEKAGLLISSSQGIKKIFRANLEHPLYGDIHSILRKYIGLDHVIEEVVRKLGNIERAYLAGNLAKGLDETRIKVILIGDSIDCAYLDRLLTKSAHLLTRKVECDIVPVSGENTYLLNNKNLLLIWKSNEPGE